MDQDELSAIISKAQNDGSLTLDLSKKELRALPPEIGNLTGLTSLNIKSNLLKTLPPDIGNLTNLTELDLSVNSLTELPPEIGNLTSLTSLNIDLNMLSALPPDIGNLTSLTSLSLNAAKLTVLPPEIGNLTSLTSLSLIADPLTALPLEIGNLTNLTELLLGNNQLTGLRPWIGNLTSLIRLRLRYNQLSELPWEIGNLTGLTWLDLSENQLTTLPSEIGNLTLLTTLDLSKNQLTTLPPEIGNLTSLRNLKLEGNQLTTLPHEIGNLTDLDLLENQLTASPRKTGNLPPVRHLDVGDPVRVVIEEWLVEEGMRGLPWWDMEDAELDTDRLTAQVTYAAVAGIENFMQQRSGDTLNIEFETEEWFARIYEDVGDLASSWKFWLEEQFDLSPDLHPIFQDIGDFWETALNTIVEAALPNISQEVGLSVDGAITQTNAMLDALSTAAKHCTTKAVTENLGQRMAGAALDLIDEIVWEFLDYEDMGAAEDVNETVEAARAQIQLSIEETVESLTNQTVASFSIKLSNDHSSIATGLVSEIIARSRQDDGH